MKPKLWLLYFFMLLSGLTIIEWRNGWFWCTGGIRSRVPSAVAVCNWMFFPERMDYLAASPLKANQQIRRVDLAIHPKLDIFLRDYLPAAETRVGKYLKADVAAGEPILPQNLSIEMIPKMEEGSFLVVIRMSKPPLTTNVFQPETRVALTASNLSDKIEGTVVTDIWEKPASVSVTEGTKNQKK